MQDYLHCIAECYPDLTVQQARVHNTDGQFNEVLIVNEEIIFRFPRSDETARTLATEIALLKRLQPFLTLQVPDPQFTNLDRRCSGRIFMGYPRIPGEPLLNTTVDAIQDEGVLDRIAGQLAGFLKELHSVDVAKLGVDLSLQDTRESWAALFADFRQHLYPYMRQDAQTEVTTNFERFLNDAKQFDYSPVLRHGDFGGGNIIYDPSTRSIRGVIDWDGPGLGDPATDVAAILHLGEDFFRRMCRTYPELAKLRPRVAFIQSTFALQEAYYGLRDGVKEAFESGIAQYR